jgi:CRP/FNR family cyclic AMP-dependent transcriptional regulator
MVTKRAGRFYLAVAVVVVVFWNFSGNSFAADKTKGLGLSKALGQVKLFTGLTSKERNALKSAATLRHCKEGERIIEQGRTLDRMFVVLEGQAEVRVNGKLMATLPGQSLIGEIEFLDKLPASADVVVLKEADLIELNNAALTGLMKKQPRLGYVLMSEIARIEGQRLRAMDLK